MFVGPALLLNQGIQGKSGNFIFNQGKLGGKERFLSQSGKIDELLSF